MFIVANSLTILFPRHRQLTLKHGRFVLLKRFVVVQICRGQGKNRADNKSDSKILHAKTLRSFPHCLWAQRVNLAPHGWRFVNAHHRFVRGRHPCGQNRTEGWGLEGGLNDGPVDCDTRQHDNEPGRQGHPH